MEVIRFIWGCYEAWSGTLYGTTRYILCAVSCAIYDYGTIVYFLLSFNDLFLLLPLDSS
jgi:hypothetical protein